MILSNIDSEANRLIVSREGFEDLLNAATHPSPTSDPLELQCASTIRKSFNWKSPPTLRSLSEWRLAELSRIQEPLAQPIPKKVIQDTDQDA